MHVLSMPSVPNAGEEDLAIVITVYEPEPERWIEYRKRK